VNEVSHLARISDGVATVSKKANARKKSNDLYGKYSRADKISYTKTTAVAIDKTALVKPKNYDTLVPVGLQAACDKLAALPNVQGHLIFLEATRTVSSVDTTHSTWYFMLDTVDGVENKNHAPGNDDGVDPGTQIRDSAITWLAPVAQALAGNTLEFEGGTAQEFDGFWFEATIDSVDYKGMHHQLELQKLHSHTADEVWDLTYGISTPRKILPETVNIAFSPHLDFLDAAIYRLSNMTEYPRKENKDLEGHWPYFGEPSGWLRDYVDEELRDLDPLAVNPIRDVGITSRMRVGKTYYSPEQYTTIGFAFSKHLGELYMSGYTAERIEAVQAGMHLRRIGGSGFQK